MIKYFVFAAFIAFAGNQAVQSFELSMQKQQVAMAKAGL